MKTKKVNPATQSAPPLVSPTALWYVVCMSKNNFCPYRSKGFYSKDAAALTLKDWTHRWGVVGDVIQSDNPPNRQVLE